MRLGLSLQENSSYLAEIEEYLKFILIQDSKIVPYFNQGINSMMNWNDENAANLLSDKLKDSIQRGNYKIVKVTGCTIEGHTIHATFTVGQNDIVLETII